MFLIEAYGGEADGFKTVSKTVSDGKKIIEKLKSGDDDGWERTPSGKWILVDKNHNEIKEDTEIYTIEVLYTNPDLQWKTVFVVETYGRTPELNKKFNSVSEAKEFVIKDSNESNPNWRQTADKKWVFETTTEQTEQTVVYTIQTTDAQQSK